MKMFKPECYEITAAEYGWIIAHPVKWQNEAYSIWKKRLDAVDEWIMQQYPHGLWFRQAERIWIELYLRCATIKYPEFINGVKWEEEEEREILATKPRGTFYVRSGGRIIAGHYNNADPLRIGPEGSY